MESDRRDNILEMSRATESLAGPILPTAPDSELNESRWSVISFDQREAGGLTYNQAAVLLSELDAHDVAGLCIVTDDAAARLRN